MVKSLSPISNTLSFGSKGADVLSLQTFLEQKGYLAQGNVTGFFGNLTLLALQKYQCNKGIVCEGNAISTGWGNLGKKTLTFINQDIQIMNQGGGNSVSTISGLDSLLGGRSISSLSNQELKDLIQKLTAMVLQLQIKLLQMKLGN
jgi:peptidoglycan hydrolase-like protein with peptidoglycan-binding domain